MIYRRTFLTLLLAPLTARLHSSQLDVQEMVPAFVEDTVTGIRIRFITKDPFTRAGRTIYVRLGETS